LNHGDNVWHSEEVESGSDAEVVAEAMRRHRFIGIGAGFDLYRAIV